MKKLIQTKSRLFISLLMFFMLLALPLFTACENSIESNTASVKENKDNTKGKIKIILNQPQTSGILSNTYSSPSAAARTVLPQVDLSKIVKLELTGFHDGVNSYIGSWNSIDELSSNYITLDLGHWELTLLATLENSRTFTDTQPVEVELGSINPATFTLKTTSDEGGFSIRVDFSGTAAAVTYELLKYSDNSSVDTGVLTVYSTGSTPPYYVQYIRDAQTSPLVEDTYLLKINFYGDENKKIYLNTYSEIIRVKGGFTSIAPTRSIDLNNMYQLHYHTNVTESGTEKPAAALLADGQSLVSFFSLHSGTIALPELVRTEPDSEGYYYKFGGWYADSSLSNDPLTEFKVDKNTPQTDQHFYAKWKKIYKLTYKVTNSIQNNAVDLPADDNNLKGSAPNLPVTHTEEEVTKLKAPVFYDGEGDASTNKIPFVKFTIGSFNGPEPTSNGSQYEIADQITSNTTIYIHVKPKHVYLDPQQENIGDGALGFNKNTPVKTVAKAMSWLRSSSTVYNDGLYVLSSITNDGDVSNLKNLTTSTYGETILYRHSSFKNGPLIHLSSGEVSISEVTIDGGAQWSSASIKDSTNNGLQSTAPLIIVDGTAKLTTGTNTKLRFNDNSNGTTFEIKGQATVEISDCTISKCKAKSGGGITVSETGKITSENTSKLNINNCYSTTNGGALVTGDNTTVKIYEGSFNNNAADGNGGALITGTATVQVIGGSFEGNTAGGDGGAIYNQATNLCSIKGVTFTGNSCGTSGKGGTIYDKGSLKLLGTNTFDVGDIYYDNEASTIDEIEFDLSSQFTVTGDPHTITITPSVYSIGRRVLYLDGLEQTKKEYICSKFTLADSNYEIKPDNDNKYGVIKPKPGTVTVTPGFPGKYTCSWQQTIVDGAKKISIIIKDASGSGDALTEDAFEDIKVQLYEGPDCIKTYKTSDNSLDNTLTFAYPAFLDPPTGKPFYVTFTIKKDDNTSYSYDYWPSRLWLGSKTPAEAKEVGDIVFTDGSAEPYDSTNPDFALTDTQKSQTIAVIFYNGTGLNNDGDTTTVRTLGVGIININKQWCSATAKAFSKEITPIICYSNTNSLHPEFTGDIVGKDNLTQIGAFLAEDNDTATATNYPAFYFSKNYSEQVVTSNGKQYSSHVAGTEYEKDWYLPSLAEAYTFIKALTTVNTILPICGGLTFSRGTNDYLWTSSQSSGGANEALKLPLTNGFELNNTKSSIIKVCTIREF